MKPNKRTYGLHRPTALPDPALNVVVYRSPGPHDEAVNDHARFILRSRSTCGTGGGLYHITLVESDFDRLWNGVDQGDAFGTAYSVLLCLGPDVRPFIDHHKNFIFGWVGEEDPRYGIVLLLQIIPRAHFFVGMN